MTSFNDIPTLENFLIAPIDIVAEAAPKTLVFAPGGTRRSATFAGIKPESEAFIHWSRERVTGAFELMFRHGVRHIFMALFTQTQYNESTQGYRDRIVQSIDWGVAGPDALADYDRLGWRVHLWGGEQIPALTSIQARLERRQPAQSEHNLWWFISPRPAWLWQWQAKLFYEQQIETPQAAIRLMYGQAVPPATLFLSFGKPMVSADLLPPLLADKLQCYWSQRPSYDLDANQFRKILYDYAYLRATWRVDKAGRAEEALTYQTQWENGPTIGLGSRLGPHWYPEAISAVEAEGHQQPLSVGKFAFPNSI